MGQDMARQRERWIQELGQGSESDLDGSERKGSQVGFQAPSLENGTRGSPYKAKTIDTDSVWNVLSTGPSLYTMICWGRPLSFLAGEL